MTYAIRTHQLTKGYRGKDVVSNVSMNVKRGEIYGFLGPNGAGKTTIMKMMTSLIKPTGWGHRGARDEAASQFS